MPAAAPIVGAIVSGITTAGGLGFSWAAFAGSLILGGLSYALTPKPKNPIAEGTRGGSTVAIRQPDLTHQYVYGHTRVTRGYGHMQSTGANGRLHIILILCQGELRAINEVWLNDYAIPNDWIDSNGNVTQGRYAGKLTIRKHLGSPNQTADTLAVSNMTDWTNDHRLQGIAYLYLIMDKDQDVYPNGVPNISAIVEGMSVYDPRVDANVWTTNTALMASDFTTNPVYGFGALSDDVDMVNIAAQANICDEIVETVAKNYTVKSVADGTDIITLDGELLELMFGDRVRISSTGTLPSGLAADTDYFVVPYQVKDTPRIQLASSLDNSMSKTVINITSAGSGTITITKTGEPRYHGGGIMDAETNLSQTLNDIANAMAGRTVNVGGKWSLFAGAWRTPDISFNVGDTRGGFGVKTALSMSESFNTVKGLFVSPLTLYQSSDYPAAQYSTFIEHDNNMTSVRELNLPFVQRPTMAQRIAKIELFRARQDIVYTSDFSMKGLQVQPADTVELNNEYLGWEGKVFEVTQFAFNTNDGALTTSLSLRETAEEIYDWSAGEAIAYDPAPNTNLPNPFVVEVPTGVGYNSVSNETAGADLVFTLTLQWDAHPDAFVQSYGDFEIQYKLSGEVDYRPSFFVDGALTKTDVVTASINTSYDVRIRARNRLGVRPAWSTILGAVVGYSGGVTVSNDWGTAGNPISHHLDWGNVSDSPDFNEDWGFVL
jgi:hypothetical protein